MCRFTNSPTNPVCGANRRLIPPRMSESSSSSSSSCCCPLLLLSLCRIMPRSVLLLLLSSVPDGPPARNATPPPPRRLRAAWRRRAMCASPSASSSEGEGAADVVSCDASNVGVVWSSAVSSDRWWRKIFRLLAGRKRMGTAMASGSGSWEGMLGLVVGGCLSW